MASRRKAKQKAAKKRTAARGARRRPAARKRAAKKRPARKPVKRATKKRVAKQRPARKAAKKRVARKRVARKRVARKRVARKPVAKKRPARKPVKRAARPAAKRPAKAAPAPAAFAPQKAEASAKDLLLFDLERARVSVLSAIQGLGAGTAMQPVAEGKWSIHEIVLHLGVRDRVRLEELDSLLAGNPPSWSAVSGTPAQEEQNEAHLAPLRGLSWDDAVRTLHTTRAELIERLQAVPAEPAEVWTSAHPFGATMQRLTTHDRHHAEAIKNARIAG